MPLTSLRQIVMIFEADGIHAHKSLFFFVSLIVIITTKGTVEMLPSERDDLVNR